MPPELAAAIRDCLYRFWAGQGEPAERALALAVAALQTVWDQRNAQDTWVLLPPALAGIPAPR